MALGRTHASRPPSIPRRSTMAKYLISFPSAAMVVPDGEWGAVGRDAHAVIDEAKAAGVYVFGGGIDEDVPPVIVSADGAVAMGGYPWAPTLDGGFTVLELPSRDEAIAWGARIAAEWSGWSGVEWVPADFGFGQWESPSEGASICWNL